MELRGERVVLRPLAEADVARVVELGADPSVARWWPGLTEESLRATARGEEEGVTAFAILEADEVAGMIQFYEEDDPEYRHAGIDVFLGPPFQGRGLGGDAVGTMARHLVRDRGPMWWTLADAAGNELNIATTQGRS